MNYSMTIYTNRKYIQWFIVIWMMILLCSFESARKTSTTIRRVKFAISNSVTDSSSCFIFYFIQGVIMFSPNYIFKTISNSLFCCFTFCAFLITPLTQFLLFIILTVFMSAYFTVSLMAIFSTIASVKFRKRFNLFTFGAFCRYDLFSHCLFLYKRYWLEPFARPILVCGSSYYKGEFGGVN